MSSLQDKIDTFYKKRSDIFKKPLEKIINSMLEKCTYINGESLERHNWGDSPLKLNFIPTNINSDTFESELLNALSLDENEKSIIELLWGDIQLGKRVQACVIMWISVHILKRPVLYIFRNLSIDMKQLQDDIVGTENYNFNIQFIKNLFEEFNNELQEYFGEKNVDYWKDYKLPELKDINSNDIINRLSNKEAITPNEIFCCLMNYTQLEKINRKFSEYISYNNELVNMSVLVDESDLSSPTCSNDKNNPNDEKDSTQCEMLIAKIYKKVKYALQITGTAHSLLYNVTTRLGDNSHIQIKISKIHKMKRSDDYFGLFNNSILFNTIEEKPDDELTPEERQDKYENGKLITKPVINSWWDCDKYNIVEDYNINIKKIINTIVDRKNVKYNSLLISEEKVRINQFSLVNKILTDFSDLFIVIYHGNCLRLYLSRNYEEEIKYWSEWDSKKSIRLWRPGGIYGSSIDTEKSENLPNNYCYFNIDTKILNIKFIYKLLRILFEKSRIHVKNKTSITITGKYGERGYSFTSDDYGEYSFHLTDQYLVSHASINCTDGSQRLRLQVKSNDNELKNGEMRLTLWTTLKLQDIMQNFYVNFIKQIEKFIMDCECWEDVKDLIESIIDTGELKFKDFMKYIDASKKRKNLKPQKYFDKKHNGYRLILVEDMVDSDISEWCKEAGLPEYLCVNEINDLTKEAFIETYGNYDCDVPLSIPKNNAVEFDRTSINELVLKMFPEKLDGFRLDRVVNIRKGSENSDRYNGIQYAIANDIKYNYYVTKRKPNTYNILVYDGYDNIHIVSTTNKKCLPILTNDYIKKTPYFVNGDIVKYSVLKEEYKQQNRHGYTNQDGGDFIEGLPGKYYWKTPDGWLYLFHRDKPQIISLRIVAPSTMPFINSTIPLINEDVLAFTNKCFQKTDKPNLRFGIKDIYTVYTQWCKLNKKKYLKTQKKLKEELEKLNYMEVTTKGVDINNNPGKRGYNLMVAL